MSKAEVKANASSFFDAIPVSVKDNMAEIRGHSEDALARSYERLTSIQAWRSFVLENVLSEEALGFYAEAQNDGIVSAVLASCGLWRSSLKSIRSAIENIIRTIYYKDHPVEYRLWEEGKHRPAFEFYFNYVKDHPDLKGLPEAIIGINELKRRYSRLSDAVHSSSKELRMVDDLGALVLWKTDAPSLSKWESFHKDTYININLLLMCIFREHLTGAAVVGLRRAISQIVPATKRSVIRENLGISLPSR